MSNCCIHWCRMFHRHVLSGLYELSSRRTFEVAGCGRRSVCTGKMDMKPGALAYVHWDTYKGRSRCCLHNTTTNVTGC